MWESEADWDDLVEESLVNKAQQWYEELSALPCLLVPRCLRAEATARGITLRTFVVVTKTRRSENSTRKMCKSDPFSPQ